jgi:hypothetical protein
MPDPGTPAQSTAGTPPRQPTGGAAQPLPAEVRPWHQQAPGRLRAAISQMRGMTRKALRRA